MIWWLDTVLWFTGLIVWAAGITALSGLVGAIIIVVVQAAHFSYRIHKVLAPRSTVEQFLARWEYLIRNMPDAMRVRTAVNPDVWTTMTWDGTEPLDEF